MIPAAFDYLRAHTTDEAIAHLQQHGAEARVLAGGQSLIPAMRFRLARPAVLVDINGVPGLAEVTRAKYTPAFRFREMFSVPIPEATEVASTSSGSIVPLLFRSWISTRSASPVSPLDSLSLALKFPLAMVLNL